jgi:hypothetical protein
MQFLHKIEGFKLYNINIISWITIWLTAKTIGRKYNGPRLQSHYIFEEIIKWWDDTGIEATHQQASERVLSEANLEASYSIQHSFIDTVFNVIHNQLYKNF